MPEKKLSTFFPQESSITDQWQIRGSLENPVRGLEFDSRRVEKGYLFVAFSGTHTDGHRFIPGVQAAGATVIVHSQDLPEYLPEITYLQVPDTRRAFSLLSAAFYEHPSKALPTIGITGTDGKSTTVSFLHQLLTLGGKSAGFISTVAFDTGTGIKLKLGSAGPLKHHRFNPKQATKNFSQPKASNNCNSSTKSRQNL
jgi:UDP-N-acetylmuramyl tripeptide synthase